MTLITPDKFVKSLEIIREASQVAIDCETYWTSYSHKKRIVGVSVYGEVENKYFSGYFPFRHRLDLNGETPRNYKNFDKQDMERLVQVLDSVPCHIYHNAKFDRSRFVLEGLQLTKPFYCTMIMSHMWDENISHELEDLAVLFKIDPEAKRRKAQMHELRRRIVWHGIPLNYMEPYACGDTRNAYKLCHKLIPLLQEQELDSLWLEEALYSEALMNMELVGIKIDPDCAEKLSEEAEDRMEAIVKELRFNPAGKIELSKKLFMDLGLPILERGKPTKLWPDGAPSMGEPILEQLKKRSNKPSVINLLDLVLEYRGLQKAKSTWYDGFIEACDHDNRIHSNYSQHGTVTTRLSSNTPNMEQIPRDIESTPVKKMLRAGKGFELWEFDYSQIEYRLAGVLSGDPIILEAYRSGSDMHQVTGDKLGFSRQNAKTLNFLLIYLGGSGRIVDTFGITLEEARPIYNEYHKLYEEMFRFAGRVNDTAAQRGYIKLWNGRRRHFKFQWETHKAWNSLVQGGAAQICKKGMLNLFKDKTLQSRVNNQVHDSLWIEIPEDLVYHESARIRWHMEWPSRDPRFKIPFPVEAKRLA